MHHGRVMGGGRGGGRGARQWGMEGDIGGSGVDESVRR